MAYTHDVNGYRTHKCRCEVCRAAWAAYMRDWSARNAEAVKKKRAARAARDWQSLTPEQRAEQRAKQQAWMEANPDKVKANRERARANRAERRRTDPEFRARELANRDKTKMAVNARRHLLKKKYGLTLEQFDQMVEAQENKCAICLQDQGEVKMHIDHDHDTGRVRALLCTRCNVGLGTFVDDADRMRRAADYVELHRKVT